MVDELQSVPPTEPISELPSMVVGEPMKPVAASERIHTLDVLRGFAIFGIFMVNIAFFSMPMADAIGQGEGEITSTDHILYSVVKALFEFKFVSIFSLLFGMGLVIQMSRAAKRNRPFVGLYLRRTFLLMAMGAIHGFLMWYGDILFVYSFVAIIALLMRNIRPKVMMWLATVALALSIFFGSAINYLMVFSSSFATQTAQEVESPAEKTEQPIDDMDRFNSVFSPSTKGNDPKSLIKAEVVAYKEGPMLATMIMRAYTFFMMIGFAVFAGFGLRILTMFLIGIMLIKLNFFDKKHRRWHVKLCTLGLLIGGLGEFSVVIIHYLNEHEMDYVWATAESLHQVTSFFLCFGYIGAITLIVQAGLLRWLTYAFSCVGRTALSNYLLQTIVATYIMYWWGLGMFNDVSRPQQMAIVVSVYCCQLVLSVLYLQVFSIGPFEWLWRSLTYLKFQPILRQASTTTP